MVVIRLCFIDFLTFQQKTADCYIGNGKRAKQR